MMAHITLFNAGARISVTFRVVFESLEVDSVAAIAAHVARLKIVDDAVGKMGMTVSTVRRVLVDYPVAVGWRVRVDAVVPEVVGVIGTGVTHFARAVQVIIVSIGKGVNRAVEGHKSYWCVGVYGGIVNVRPHPS
jgi:hypothetical protein